MSRVRRLSVGPLKSFQIKTLKTDSCWLWLGLSDAQGYGLFSIGGSQVKAHRLAWIIEHGPIPQELMVCHHCDTPACVNPDHLFLGTALDNQRDSIAKGRRPWQRSE